MDVNVQMTVEVAGKTEQVRAAPEIAHGRVRRFLHHVPELSGGTQFTASFHGGCFRSQNLAADLGPG
jgi:hypothetical protein